MYDIKMVSDVYLQLCQHLVYYSIKNGKSYAEEK